VPPRKASQPPAFSAEDIASAWRDAQAVWDVAVQLSPPEALAARGAEHWGGEDPLAYIDLGRRQVVVNFELLAEIGAKGSLTAVLAHEIGHHVRHPHTLGLAAQLELLEKRLIPGLREPLGNLFFDLLINEHVGKTRAGELAAVYAGFVARPGADPPGPLFWMYLAVYEELWGLAPETLVPRGSARTMEERYPAAAPRPGCSRRPSGRCPTSICNTSTSRAPSCATCPTREGRRPDPARPRPAVARRRRLRWSDLRQPAGRARASRRRERAAGSRRGPRSRPPPTR
jgi:hypothetical protein